MFANALGDRALRRLMTILLYIIQHSLSASWEKKIQAWTIWSHLVLSFVGDDNSPFAWQRVTTPSAQKKAQKNKESFCSNLDFMRLVT